jgi:RNA polymerase sigma factor (sigma-70 family)
MNDPLHLVAVPSEQAFATDEARSFEDFFRSEKEALYRTLCFVTRNRHEAEELTQDAFVRVLERWERVSGLEDPRAYLYRTAMNTFRSRYRRALLAAKRSFGAIPPDDEIAAVDERDVAVRALATPVAEATGRRRVDRRARLPVQGGRSHARHPTVHRPHARVARPRRPEGSDDR